MQIKYILNFIYNKKLILPGYTHYTDIPRGCNYSYNIINTK